MKARLISCFAILAAITPVYFGCVEPYNEKSLGYEKVIVVDGVLTNESKVHVVNLSYTNPIGSDAYTPIIDANVWVESSDGVRIDFNHLGDGQYGSDPNFKGTIGHTYQLFFNTKDGTSYHSIPEQLIASPPIDSIYDRYAELPNEDLISNEPGIQFFLDTHDDSGNAKWFRYEWSDTYEIRPDYPSLYDFEITITKDTVIVLFGIPTLIEGDTTTRIFARDTLLFPCYKSRYSSDLITGSSVGFSLYALREMPISFVSGLKEYLRNKYSISVKQFAINETTYNFYRKIKEASESTGSLFDQQQGAYIGNIRSIDNPEAMVLGYFEVSGSSELTAFFTYRDLDPRLSRAENGYKCYGRNTLYIRGGNPTFDSLEIWAFLAPELDVNDPIQEAYNVIDYSTDPPSISFAPVQCTTCDWFGSLKVPEFWPEEFVER